MVGGRLCCLSCFFTCSSVLLLGVCLHAVEASSCQRVLHKKVGDSVELLSCLPPEGVAAASWRYRGLLIADTDSNVDAKQFKGRLELNKTNFSLRLRELTLQDSGDFLFSSEVNYQQRVPVTVTLQVHEPITKQPVLTLNSTWNPSTSSCSVLLECSSADKNVTYSWTVNSQRTEALSQSMEGPKLQYNTKPQDGAVTFTCTVSNVVSQMSTSKEVTCSNSTGDTQPGTSRGDFVTIVILAIGGCVLTVVIVGVSVGCYQCRRSGEGSEANDLTVYADISEVTADNTPSTMKPCSVYETIDNGFTPSKPGPQTVYDKIQLSRVRKASVSPYQDIS